MSVTGRDFLSLQVGDLDRSRELCCGLLGVAPAAGSPPGVLPLDGGAVPFALRGQDADTPPAGDAGHGVVVWLADALRDRVVQAEVLRPVVDGPFGRMVTVTDPDGYRPTPHQASR